MLNSRWLLFAGLAALLACGGDNDTDDAAAADADTSTDAAPDGAGDAADVGADVEPGPDAVVDASRDGSPNDTATDAADAADTLTTPPDFLTPAEAYERVNSFIGAGGVGFGYAALTPAAQLPNGFVKVGPDTTIGGNHAPQNHFSGYYDLDPHVRGFSHIRLIGTGAVDLGNLRFLPLAEPAEEPWRAWTPLDKDSEAASPGYYSADLPDEGVSVEMAAARFGAVHRYTFDGDAVVQIDAASSITDSGVQIADISVEGASITGSVTHRGGFTGRSREFTLFFDIEVSSDAFTHRLWGDEGVVDGDVIAGVRAGATLTFDTDALSEGAVELRVGLSLQDAGSARANREAQVSGSLEDVAAAAAAEWQALLSGVRIAGGTERQQTIFYSAMHNAYRMPTQLSEPSRMYRGFDGELHELEPDDGEYYSDLSLWDTYRTLHPWYSLTNHTLQRDCLRSLLAMNAQGDRGMPRWPAMLSYSGSMIGSSADIVFGDAAAKGVQGIDWGEAYTALHNSAYGRTFDEPLSTGRDGIEDYVALGYLPSDRHNESVSKSLEYYWDDFGMASVARAAGMDEQADALLESSRGFVNLFDPGRGHIWPRDAAGDFEETGNASAVYMREGPFTEGSSWHWRFYALHAPDALVDAMAAADVDLTEMLERFYTQSRLGDPGRPNPALPDPYYWHGNEPAIHTAALFHAAGQPQRATYWMREVQERLYDDTPAGIPGNDDGGTLSTWYLFTALGLYPVAGSDLYYLSAPLFERAEVQMEGGLLIIEAPGASLQNQVVSEIRLDGEVIGGADFDGAGVSGGWTVRHADLIDATLEFTLEAANE